MDVIAILNKIKENFLLLKEEKMDALTKDKTLWDSFYYLLTCLVISFPILLFASLFLYPATTDLNGFIAPREISFTEKFVTLFFGTLVGLVVSIPVRYISFGIMHLFLKLLGGKADFKRTIQLFIYGGTGSEVFSKFPLLDLVFYLVAMANIVLGAKKVHDLPLWKAIVALVVIPGILLGIIALALVAYLTPVLSVMGTPPLPVS